MRTLKPNSYLHFLSFRITGERCKVVWLTANGMSGWERNDILADGPLKVQPCKLYNNKYVMTSTQITNTEIFTFIVSRF